MKDELNKKSVDTIIKILDQRIEQCKKAMPMRFKEEDLTGYVREKAELFAYSDVYALIMHELRR